MNSNNVYFTLKIELYSYKFIENRIKRGQQNQYLTRLKSKVFSLERLWRDCGSKEILGLKKVVKKILVGNIFGSKHIFCPTKILGPKKILSLKDFGWKNCCVRNKFWTPKNVGSQKIFAPKKFGVQKMWGPKTIVQ